MTSEDKSTTRRGRAIAVAGLAAALAGSGFIAAGAANAAGTVTLTNTAPTSILNTGDTSASAGNLLTLVADNETGALVVGATLQATVSIPAGVNCNNVSLAPRTGDSGATPPTTTGPTFLLFAGGTSGTCTSTGAIGDSNAVPPTGLATGTTTFDYTLSVDASGATTNTGTVATQFSLTNATGNVSATSNTGSTQLVGPSAAVFAAAAPTGIVYQPYKYQAFSTFPKPAGTLRLETSVVNKTTDASGNTTVSYGALTSKDITGNKSVPLNDDLKFDATTGIISRDATATKAKKTDRIPNAVYYIVSKGTTGGATAASNSSGAGSTPPTPDVAVGEVASPLVDIPTLFSDVPATGTFSNNIYGLSQANPAVIQGFADGTFRPTADVLRQEFVTYAAKLINAKQGAGTIDTGACTGNIFGGVTSSFSDVPNNSLFCSQINELAQLGIVQGFKDGTFRPTMQITREAIAAFIYRTNADLNGAPVSDARCTSQPFSDVSTSNVFCGDIQFAANNGITKGATATTYKPKANALRQEAAAYVYRLGTLQGLSFPS